MRYLAFLTVVLAMSAFQQTSPPDRRIAAAQLKVKASPNSSQSYNDLASALCRKARDNGDTALYDEAGRELEHSLQLSPGNYDARKLQVTVLLGKHEVAEATKLASELNHKVPDDIAGWALLVDVNVALGNLPEAERDAQWILDLRRGSSLGFEKAAGLRELFGDPEGAIEFYDEANRRTSQNDFDQRAWLLTQNARIELKAGHLKSAREFLRQALQLFPDSQLAAATLAKLHTAEENSVETAKTR
jgi:tetratricopeptide (TPR) repeat protein